MPSWDFPSPRAIAILIEHSGMQDELGDQIEAIHRRFRGSLDRSFTGTIRRFMKSPARRGSSETLKTAASGLRSNTGFNRSITQVILDRLGWSRSRLIDATICSDEVAAGRPHPDMIRALMARLGVADRAAGRQSR